MPVLLNLNLAKFVILEHYFISLVVEHGMDCGLDYLCCRRDCPIHIRVQFQIEHCITSAHPFKNRFDYRITRIWQDANQAMKLYLPKELTIVSKTGLGVGWSNIEI